MSELFLKIINMSISASYIVLAVILLRLLLKKAPKWITVLLWGIVALRLVFPFSVESVISLMPSAEVVSPTIMTDKIPAVNTGIPFINSTLNPIISESFTPLPDSSANPLQIWIPVLAAIWAVGIVALMIYTGISYARLKRRVGTAVLCRDNIYQSENVASPFVLGIIKPTIYLPFNMSEKHREGVIAHEMAHIRRKDHLWKPLGFLLLALHWFNPLMWLGYVLLCRDIELACDEKVIAELERDGRADYTEALLSCSVNRRTISACPLAFGEVGVKERVKSVLNYRKPAFWIIVAALVACIAVAICFLTNPPSDKGDNGYSDEYIESLRQQYPEYFGLDTSEGLDVIVWQMAKNHYAFALEPHFKGERDWMRLKGTNTQEMRAILSTYDIGWDNINIIPWQNPFSSYIGDGFIGKDEEDLKANLQEYVGLIRQMLSSDAPPVLHNRRVWDRYHPNDSERDPYFSVMLPALNGATVEHREDGKIYLNGEYLIGGVGYGCTSFYLSDLTGDGIPELCFCMGWGSGIVDQRIEIIDYATKTKIFTLAGRYSNDYYLFMRNGVLCVKETEYREQEAIRTGVLTYDGSNISVKWDAKANATVDSDYVYFVIH